MGENVHYRFSLGMEMDKRAKEIGMTDPRQRSTLLIAACGVIEDLFDRTPGMEMVGKQPMAQRVDRADAQGVHEARGFVRSLLERREQSPETAAAIGRREGKPLTASLPQANLARG